ncbi:MAG: BlaI/MecI/CopY family transcriptional regulator [Cellulosilyticaceae bacterium]
MIKIGVQISDAELEVMKVLWNLGSATSSEIIEVLSKTTSWKSKTIQTLITRLVGKGAIESEKVTGRVFRYKPCIEEERYLREANESFIKQLYNGSVKKMMMNFIQHNKLSPKDIDELKKLLDEKEVE